MRLRPFILCFYRTAFLIQKSGLKSSAFRPKPFPQISPKSYRHNAVSNRFSSHLSTSRTNGPRLPSLPKAGTHTRLSEKDRTQAHTRRNRGHFGWGRYHYPRSVPHVHKHPRAGYQNGVLCRFWVLAGGALPKNAESLRNSDALMRVAVPRRRGPAGLRDPVSVLWIMW